MQIPTNKDLEEAYKTEFFKGFSITEVVYLIIGFACLIGGAAIAFFVWGLPLVICTYVGIPFAFPPIFVGFYKIQGLSVFRYLLEIIYEKKTRILLYDADELPRNTTYYSMELKKKK